MTSSVAGPQILGRRATIALRPSVVQVTLILSALLGVLALGFVGFSPNRILTGKSLALWEVASTPGTIAFALAGLTLLAGALAPPHPLRNLVSGVGAIALLVVTVWVAGDVATELTAAAPSPAARVSLGGAFWVLALAAALAASDALGRLARGHWWRFGALGLVLAFLIVLALGGHFDHLSLVREWANRREAYAAELGRHLVLVVGALVPAVLVGVPLGLLALRRPGVAPGLFAGLNLVQTIPSIALFGLLIGPLTWAADVVPGLRSIGVGGIGAAPALVALVLYALLPVARSTHAGFRQVSPSVIDAARGMGMTGGQVLRRVSLPLAMPVLLSGLRIVLVQLIGLTVVAALIGAGGLGTFVFQGLGQTATDLVLLGAVSTIALALFADIVLRVTTLALRREGLK